MVAGAAALSGGPFFLDVHARRPGHAGTREATTQELPQVSPASRASTRRPCSSKLKMHPAARRRTRPLGVAAAPATRASRKTTTSHVYRTQSQPY